MKMMSLLSEGASRTAMEIGGLTGLNKDAIQKFVDTHNMDIEKVYQYVKKAKLTDRLNFVTAVVGTPGNPVQKRMIKMFGESVNEDTKKRFDVDFYKIMGDRQTSHEEIIRGDKFSDVISQATKVAKSKGMNYVEFYYKDSFIGSIDKKSNYTFKKGRNSEKSPLPVNESQDHEVSMAQNSLDSIIKYATELKQKMGEMEKDVPAWIQDHITNAENYVSQAASNYHEYGSGMNEGVLNEMNRQLNVKVNKMLSYELGDMRKGGANHLWAIMHVLIGALTDANFHSDAKKVPAIFGSKAKYEGDPQGEKDLEKMYEYDLGPTIAALAKWDGKDIVNAVGFYVSMNVGRPMGEKIEKLVEGKK